MEHKAINTLTTLLRWFGTAMAVFIVGFFIVGPPFLIARRMDGAAILIGALGIFSDFFALRTLLEIHFEKALRPVLALSVLQHSAAILIGVVMICQPLAGGWTPIPDTNHISDPGLAVSLSGRLIAVNSHKGEVDVLEQNEDGTMESLDYTGGFGWETGDDADLGLWVGGHQSPIYTRASEGPWRRWRRPEGWLRSMAVHRGVIYLAAQGRLYRSDDPEGPWETIREPFISGVGVDQGTGRVVAVGARWWQSEDGGESWRDITPEDAPRGIPDARLSQGWRYVFEGGLFRSYLYAASPGDPLKQREMPATDVRVMLVNPDKGAEIWIACWGEGVWRSRDGGESWSDMGMQSAQIRAMAIDWRSHTAYVGPSHMMAGNGLFELRFEP